MYDKSPFLLLFINLPKAKKQVFYVTLWIVLVALLFSSWPLSSSSSSYNHEDGTDPQTPNKALKNNKKNNHDDATTTPPTLTTSPHRPSIAWLLSFPNSGTSYTLANINQVTQRLVATNYNVAGRSESEHFPLYDKGPFLLSLQQDDESVHLLPDTYILTKTHCAAYCVDCPTRNFLHWSIEAFVDGCRTSKEKQQHDNTTTTILHKTMYPAAWVKRAVHLMRNPFDNLVARMHLSLRDQRGSATTDDDDDKHNSRQTLLTWCHKTVDADRDDFFQALALDNNHTQTLLEQLPCPAEWYRWIQWHNLACQMTHDVLQIPVHYLYYEDYTSHYNQTVAALLDFLDLTPAAAVVPLPFATGKTYQHLFTPTERQAAAQVVRALATPTCWERVKHYFGQE